MKKILLICLGVFSVLLLSGGLGGLFHAERGAHQL